LPLANESVNAIVLQHVTAGDADQLLDECERVLMPGGHLWLSSLNPFSPYRTLAPAWAGGAHAAADPPAARPPRAGVRRYALPRPALARCRQPSPGGWAPLRAACLFHAEKRTLALPGRNRCRCVGSAPLLPDLELY
jgi:SAM-dependent methyltransferase